jgi:hypothetical protein
MVAVKGQDGGASGYSPPPPFGVWGDSATGYGVVGASSTHAAVYGRSSGALDPQDLTVAPAGVLGDAIRYIGVYGRGLQFGGVFGEGGQYGVAGYSQVGTGVWGTSEAGNGVAGTSQQLNGVQGQSGSQAASGVYGENSSGGGFGVAGRSNARSGAFGAAVLGDNTAGGNAGIFNGRVVVNGFLAKNGGGFQIDHPLDPANRYLNHSFVESPDMMNIYNGNVTTDEDGNATIELPAYFEALNRDFRYQLTVLGQFAQAVVAEEVSNNRFSIRTDKPDVRVSWQVTGIRQDAWANANRTEAEAEKPDGHRGKYLSATEHDQPASAGLYYTELPASSTPPSVGSGLAALRSGESAT